LIEGKIKTCLNIKYQLLAKRTARFLLFLTATLFVCAGSARNVLASNEAEASDSTVQILLPFASFNSDVGLIGGGSWDRYRYSDSLQPYRNLTQARIQLSTKGRFLVRFTHERLQFLNSDFRVRASLRIDRLLNDNYFGLGNNTEIRDRLMGSDFYSYESRSGRAWIRARYPLRDQQSANLDLLLLGEGRYFRALKLDDRESNNGSKLFQEELIQQVNSSPWISFWGGGLLWDSRDREINTRNGTYGEVLLRGSPGLSAVSEPLLNVALDLRGFYNIEELGNLVLAGRLGGEWMTGDAPFWLLPALGGEDNLRGYHLRRFRDNGIFLNSLIARRWLASFDWLSLRLGAQAITEGGRTFGRYSQSDASFFENHKRSYGGGLLISAFTEDFIVRADYVGSAETKRIYLNLGYVF
jgi:hypothetical protein